MLDVEITYNPYFVATQLVVDGEIIPENSRLAALCKNERIQNWIDKFLPVLYDEKREKKVVFKFIGTDLDADDVRNAIEAFNDTNPGYHFELKEVVSNHSGVNRVGKLKELFEEGQHGPFKDTFNSHEMQRAFNEALDPTFEVNVIATMSSGKSTVINAMLGKELMPAKNEACTATIARVKNNDSAPLFTAQRFAKNGKKLSEIQEATSELLAEWNEDSKTSRIDIEGNIPTVQQTDECQMVFVDTPGPNSSQNDEHKRITLETIKSKPLSMVLYVLNASQLGTNDDRWLLDQVCSAMSAGGRQAQDRFVFLANKIDNFDPAEGDSVTSALRNVKEYLQCRDSNGIIQGIENPLIIPVSAQLAKMIRIKQAQGKLVNDRVEEKLETMVKLFVQEKEMNMVEHVETRLNSDCVKRLKDRIENAQNNEKLAEVLSGIPIVEELLNDFLQKHAMPAKLKDAVDSLDRVMQEAKIAEKMDALLKKNDAEVTEVISKIKAFKEDKDRIKKGNAFRKEISAMSYSISPATNEEVLAFLPKSELVTHDFRKQADSGKASKQEAEHAYNNATKQCKEFDIEVNVSLNGALHNEYYAVMTKLREEYQEYVESVLNKRFPEETDLRELQTAVMSMPSVQDMIDTNLKIEKNTVCVGSREVSDSSWYLPWTWFSTRTVYDYETQEEEYVDLKPIADELATSLRHTTNFNIEGFIKQATANVDNAKKLLLQIMDGIDAEVDKVQNKLIEAEKNKDVKEEIRKENQKKMDWFNDFNQKLNAILAV